MKRKIVSACLLGASCRWDGNVKPNEKIINLARREFLIPVCPEQLGGLSTPRDPALRIGDKVMTRQGEDVTERFRKGAEETLLIAKVFGIKEAILKERSPSCGSKNIYENFCSRNTVPGMGVTAELLRENNIKVISEEEV